MKKVVFILSVLLITACKQVSTTNPSQNDQLACLSNSDCACGVQKDTGQCFFGNKNFVNTLKQCPDFCNGFSGDLTIVCQNNQCVQKQL